MAVRTRQRRRAIRGNGMNHRSRGIVDGWREHGEAVKVLVVRRGIRNLTARGRVVVIGPRSGRRRRRRRARGRRRASAQQRQGATPALFNGEKIISRGWGARQRARARARSKEEATRPPREREAEQQQRRAAERQQTTTTRFPVASLAFWFFASGVAVTSMPPEAATSVCLCFPRFRCSYSRSLATCSLAYPSPSSRLSPSSRISLSFFAYLSPSSRISLSFFAYPSPSSRISLSRISLAMDDSLWLHVHIGCSLFTYGLLVPLNVLLARFGAKFYTRHLRRWFFGWSWLDAHLYIHLVSTILTAVGLAVPFLFLVADDFEHMTTVHSFLGLLVAAFVCFAQPIFGLPDELASSADKAFSLRTHSVLGRAGTWISAMVIVLGSWQSKHLSLLPISPEELDLFLKLWLIVIFTPLLLLELYRAKTTFSSTQRSRKSSSSRNKDDAHNNDDDKKKR